MDLLVEDGQDPVLQLERGPGLGGVRDLQHQLVALGGLQPEVLVSLAGQGLGLGLHAVQLSGELPDLGEGERGERMGDLNHG
jgi:hypothetical protein